MDNLEKVGITMMLEDLKPIKTNKQLALETGRHCTIYGKQMQRRFIL